MFKELFTAIESSGMGVAISQSAWLFPTIESVHVLALTTVIGSILIMDCRLVGLFGRSQRVTRIAHDVLPFTWGGFVVAAISGLTLFTSAAVRYTENPFFLTKFALMALAGLNMLYFHFVTWKTVNAWDAQETPPAGARVAGLFSILFWIGVVVCGRWVGFT